MAVKVSLVVVVAVLAASVASSGSAAQPRVGCTPAQTRVLVREFVAAFNRGDGTAINATWASRLWFKWYSVTSGPGARTPQDSARRDTLLPYFADRHTAHELLTIESLKINGVSGGAYRNFEFRLTRSADDDPGSPARFVGKGASTCSTGRLFVWVMSAAP